MSNPFYEQVMIEVAKVRHRLTPTILKEICDCFGLTLRKGYAYCNLLESKGIFKKIGDRKGHIAWYEIIK